MSPPSGHLKSHARDRALLCEQRALNALDEDAQREWTELAIEWHLLATTVANEDSDIEGL